MIRGTCIFGMAPDSFIFRTLPAVAAFLQASALSLLWKLEEMARSCGTIAVARQSSYASDTDEGLLTGLKTAERDNPRRRTFRALYIYEYLFLEPSQTT